MLFPRLRSPFKLAGDWIIAFVIPALSLLVVVVISRSVGVMLPGLAIYPPPSMSRGWGVGGQRGVTIHPVEWCCGLHGPIVSPARVPLVWWVPPTPLADAD